MHFFQQLEFLAGLCEDAAFATPSATPAQKDTVSATLAPQDTVKPVNNRRSWNMPEEDYSSSPKPVDRRSVNMTIDLDGDSEDEPCTPPKKAKKSQPIDLSSDSDSF